ncbi:MAG TPA: wax ester/triacylglycerol synthase family O-acyltransferase, partial [Polyangiaceae bacterium]
MERLSGLDASFLYFETSAQHMHVSIVAVLDPAEMPGGYSFDRIQELIASRLHLLPPFHRRLVRVPFNLHHPLWVEDPEFDIIHHVRRVSCPAPGGQRELAAICGRITSTPLDRSRPLWEVWVIEGLAGGCFAFVTKVHHCAVDGVSGAELMVHLFGVERDTRTPPPAPAAAPEHIPTDAEIVRHALASRLRQPVEMVQLARRTVSAVAGVVRRRRDPQTTSGATPLTAPRTRFNGAITAQRTMAFARVPLGPVKAIRKTLGVTVNDVVLALCAGTLRRYLAALGELPASPLVAVCPISVRDATAPKRSANSVSAMFTSLATDVAEPLQRLRAIQSVTRGAKDEHHAIGADLLQNWAEFAAPTTFSLAARLYARMKLADRHPPVHNLVISNVPGPPFPLYLAGAELVAAYPMGPVFEGAGLNVTVLSYKGSLDFGFNAAANSVP